MTENANEPQPGFWLFSFRRNCPEVPARIFWCDSEPGDPENKVDQPYLQGQIALDLYDPLRIWTGRRRAIDAAEYEHRVRWLRWAEKNAPTHPQLRWREPVRAADIPIPKFRSAQ